MSFLFSAKVLLLIAILLVVPPVIWADSADELVKQGNLCDVRLQAAKALQLYLPAEKLHPNDSLLLVRIARQYRHLMSDSTDNGEKFRLGGTALAYARRAVALSPNSSEAQLALAISYAKILPLQSTKEQMEDSRRIKVTAEKAIKLDPKNDLAWHVLGRWHLALADVGEVKRALASVVYGELPSTTYEAAANCFLRAISLNPTRLMHYVELGRTYAQMGRVAEARQLISKGLAMPNVEKDDEETKERGRETLAKLH